MWEEAWDPGGGFSGPQEGRTGRVAQQTQQGDHVQGADHVGDTKGSVWSSEHWPGQAAILRLCLVSLEKDILLAPQPLSLSNNNDDDSDVRHSQAPWSSHTPFTYFTPGSCSKDLLSIDDLRGCVVF